MNFLKYFFLLVSLLSGTYGFAQKNISAHTNNPSTAQQLTVEPGIGIHTNFGTDFLITNLVQWNPHKPLLLRHTVPLISTI